MCTTCQLPLVSKVFWQQNTKAAPSFAFFLPVTSPTRDLSPRTVLSCPFLSVSSPGVMFKQSNIHT